MKQKSDKIVPAKKSSAVYKSSEWLLKSKDMKYRFIIMIIIFILEQLQKLYENKYTVYKYSNLSVYNLFVYYSWRFFYLKEKYFIS